MYHILEHSDVLRFQIKEITTTTLRENFGSSHHTSHSSLSGTFEPQRFSISTEATLWISGNTCKQTSSIHYTTSTHNSHYTFVRTLLYSSLSSYCRPYRRDTTWSSIHFYHFQTTNIFRNTSLLCVLYTFCTYQSPTERRNECEWSSECEGVCTSE